MGDKLGSLQDNQKNSYKIVNESGEDKIAQRVYVHGGTIIVDSVLTEVEVINDVGNPLPVNNTNLPPGASTEDKQDVGNTSLNSIDNKIDLLNLESTQQIVSDRIGDLTEAAPLTDTGSSGLNGRLQRIAQRLTSLISLFPISIGQKTAAGSLSVVLSSDQNNVTANAGTNLNTSALALETTQETGNNRLGDLTETAPLTDTASSGLNGRLQRIAQRLTSLITAITDKTQWTKLTDGTTDAVIKPASTFVNTTDTALVVGNSPFNYTRIKAAATTTIKSGAGVLHSIVINTQANGTATVYDNTVGAGTIIALVTTTNNLVVATLLYDIKFTTGLTIVTSSANPDYTITWK